MCLHRHTITPVQLLLAVKYRKIGDFEMQLLHSTMLVHMYAIMSANIHVAPALDSPSHDATDSAVVICTEPGLVPTDSRDGGCPRGAQMVNSEVKSDIKTLRESDKSSDRFRRCCRLPCSAIKCRAGFYRHEVKRGPFACYKTSGHAGQTSGPCKQCEPGTYSTGEDNDYCLVKRNCWCAGRMTLAYGNMTSDTQCGRCLVGFMEYPGRADECVASRSTIYKAEVQYAKNRCFGQAGKNARADSAADLSREMSKTSSSTTLLKTEDSTYVDSTTLLLAVGVVVLSALVVVIIIIQLLYYRAYKSQTRSRYRPAVGNHDLHMRHMSVDSGISTRLMTQREMSRSSTENGSSLHCSVPLMPA